MNVNLDTTRIKKLVRMVTKPIEDQMYKLMTVEFVSGSDKSWMLQTNYA